MINPLMKAAAQVVVEARKIMSQTGQLTRDLYWDTGFDWEGHVIIHKDHIHSLEVALDVFETMEDMVDAHDAHENDGQDHNDTILSFAGDVESAIRRGAKRE